MKTEKYRATILGLITTAICGVIYAGALSIPGLLIFPLIIVFSSIPFYYLGGWIFGENNYQLIALTVLFFELILLFILSFQYFKKLIRDERNKMAFNRTRLMVFFVFLQFIIHPIGFYGWLIINEVDQSDSMILFYIIETLPFSGVAFTLLGVIIDIVRNRIAHK